MKRYAFIFNAQSGAVKSEYKREQLEQLIADLPKAKLFSLNPTESISKFVEELSANYDVIVACGGDGTAREVALPLINTDKIMGIVPMETANDLCKTLHIPSDVHKAFNVLREGHIIKMDVGRCNEFIFLNSLGFGFDGLTNRYAQQMRNVPGSLKYIAATLKAVTVQNNFTVQMKRDGVYEKGKLLMLSCANGRVEGGNFWIAPEASITDSKLDLVTVSPVAKWLIPFLLPLFFNKKSLLFTTGSNK